MGTKAFLKAAFLRCALILLLVLVSTAARGRGAPAALASTGSAPAPKKGISSWRSSLKKKLSELDARHPGQLGIFVKDLESDEELSLHGEETWYLASGVKVPVALEIMRQIERGKFTLDSKIRLRASDYVDGAGGTNRKKPGTLLTVRYLLEQMLIHSDNTASDLLIRKAGLERINRLVKAHVPEGFAEITTLAQVRRLAYSGFHPAASRLTNRDFMLLKSIPGEHEKVRRLALMLKREPAEFRAQTLNDAYSAYYAQHFNSARLSAYALLLEKLNRGEILSAWGTSYLMKIMSRVETGKNRVIAGLPANVAFAHKTGTQHARICDFGIAWDRSGGRKVVIAACARGFGRMADAERALKSMGEALSESGVFQAPSEA